uniref:Uncharacterized protein n=1 Tax=viral metagenome TaxID=1070528 RepID=A0A6C0C7G7_9ZZZZ
MYLFTLFLVTFAAKEKCNALHSTFFNNNYGKTSARFFVKETFAYTDPCGVITNAEFSKQYPQFKSGNDVEHIIDTAFSEYELRDCDKNIIGNLVMADRSWNRGVGQLCWENVKTEKMIVYEDIFQQAMNNVRKCCNLEQDDPMMAIVGCIILGLIIAVCIACIVIKKYCQGDDLY